MTSTHRSLLQARSSLVPCWVLSAREVCLAHSRCSLTALRGYLVPHFTQGDTEAQASCPHFQAKLIWERPHSGQFSSVAQSCLTLCDPMGCSTPGLPVHHQLLELVHQVRDATQPSPPLSSPSPPVPNPSQHKSLFQ